MTRCPDKLSADTCCKSTNGSKSSNKDDIEEEFNPNDLMDLERFTNPNYSIEDNMGTSKLLIQYGQITDNQGTDFNHYVEFPSPTLPAYITPQIPDTSPTKSTSTK